MTHRHGKLLLIALTLVFFAPMACRGEVIFPHPNDLEAGLREMPADELAKKGRGAEAYRPASRRELAERTGFSDLSSTYIPHVEEHLSGARSSWLTTWSPHTELGRPANQQYGSLGRVYLLTHPLFLLGDDPFVVHTWIVVLAVLLTGLFGYLLLQSLGLCPEASLVGALGLGLGVQICRKLIFVLFVWGPCWTLAILLGVTLFLRKPSLLRGLGLAFFVYSMLLTAYPQEIIWACYIVCGYVGYHLFRHRPGVRRGAVLVAGLGLSALVGLLAAAPVYLDLLLNAARSARLEVEEGFLLYGMPTAQGWEWALTFCSRLFDSFWFGNPNEHGYPFGFRSWCLTPLYAGLVFVAALHVRRKGLVPLLVFFAFTLVMTFWHAAYAFGVEFLGLHLSRHPPMRQAYLPLMLLAAFGCDHVLRAGPEDRWKRVGVACIPGVLAVLGAWLAKPAVQPGMVAIGSAIYLGALVFVYTGNRPLLLLLAVATLFQYGYRLQLTQPLDGIARTSPLVELLQEETRDGSRYAWVGTHQAVMPPNQEALYDLFSIHTYNSLSSRIYQDWVERVSTQGARHRGARFFHISGPEKVRDGVEDEFAALHLIVSKQRVRGRLRGKVQKELMEFNSGGVYRLRGEPMLEAQVLDFEALDGGEARIEGSLREAERAPVERTVDEGDRIVLEVTPSEGETLLFVSQQYHPQWRARVDGLAAECVLVNGFYQGVRLPPGAEEVELRFLPHIRWSWIPQAGFLLAGVAVLATRVRRGRMPPSDSGSGPDPA